MKEIKISHITIHNYLKNNPDISEEDLIESYFLIYGGLGYDSDKDKEIIKKQIKANLEILKRKELI